MLKPPRLNPGDTVAIVAPASPPLDPAVIDRGVVAVRQLGFKPKLGANVRKRWGFLAGTDSERASDLLHAFTDAEVRGIFCLRGGYGAGRLLDLLDYKLVQANPKVFAGYSDITALHCALITKAGLVTFHGPTINSDLLREKPVEFTLHSFRRTLMESKPPGSIRQGYHEDTIQVLHGGTASGPLLGGNLSLLCSLVGTPYQPKFEGRILILEDIDEPPYRFDRMLTHLLNAKLLQNIAGVAVGLNRNCTEESREPKYGRRAGDSKGEEREFRQSVEDVIKERLCQLGVPVLCGLPFGHVAHNATLPLGALATLDTESKDLVVTETAVV